MKKKQNIKVVIADDHEIFRDGFKLLLHNIDGIVILGEASNGEELLSLVERVLPDIVITDIKMPVMDGIEATERLIKKFPSLKIIALSMFSDEDVVLKMIEAGAKGYLLKNVSKDEIVNAIKAVYNNKTYIDPQISDILLNIIKLRRTSEEINTSKKFTDRELEIIKYSCEGYSIKEIAVELGLASRTIERYREAILDKMEVKNIAGLVLYAIKNGIHPI